MWAKSHGTAGASLAELATDPDVVAEVQRGVDEINKQFAQVEQIKKFTLVGEEWLPDSDMLTPTSKLKRRGVDARYASEIEAMYAGSSLAVELAEDPLQGGDVGVAEHVGEVLLHHSPIGDVGVAPLGSAVARQ